MVADGLITSTRCPQVLVASDAVGMGLNLNIRRVIFHSLSKFDGRSGASRAPHSPPCCCLC